MTAQLIEAGILLSVGMAVVFAFLIMLIGGIKVIAWYAAKFPGPIDTQSQAPATPQHMTKSAADTASLTSSVTPDIIAAITAAIHLHRQTKPQQCKAPHRHNQP
jgi:oxaloacetate decarboxylase gamma subunit